MIISLVEIQTVDSSPLRAQKERRGKVLGSEVKAILVTQLSRLGGRVSVHILGGSQNLKALSSH